MGRKLRKPRVFIGSSVESLPYAYAVQENLDPHDAEVTVWPQGIFQISSYTLDSLIETLKSHDFGVFIFAADDTILMRDQRKSVVRDNVLFELGLFMGGLGRERTFVIAPSGAKLHLPTDLLGWNIATYDARRKDRVAALGVASNKIRIAMQRLGVRRSSSTLRLASLRMPIESAPPFPAIQSTGRRKAKSTSSKRKRT